MREASFGCRYSGDRATVPKGLQIRSFAGLDAQQPTQMAIVSLKSFLGASPEELLSHMRAETRLSCQLDWEPSPTCPCQAVWNVSYRSPFWFLR
jgi:hypothetical protein